MKKSNWLFTILPDVTHTTLAVALSTVGILLLSLALALTGWNTVGMLISLVIGLITVRTVMVVYWSSQDMHSRSVELIESARAAEEHYISVLQRIVRFAELRQGRDIGRSERVGNLCEDIARRMSLPKRQCHLMNLAGQLHDIGLLTVPEYILKKSSQLNGNEFISITKHPEASCEILRPLAMLDEVLDGIRHHHERLNGSGYPDGLNSPNLSVHAKILAVCDVYEAMTHDRPHRRAISSLDAVSELRRCCPEGFDADIVEILADIKHIPVLEEIMGDAQLKPKPEPVYASN
ncbi:MAG TPA: HD domain-containing protein [Phycisphaerae bacterium]|nr:HD domain-containing protein [Phycisphaerae bacterium]